MYVQLFVLSLDQSDQVAAQKHLHLCVAVLEELVGRDISPVSEVVHLCKYSQ